MSNQPPSSPIDHILLPILPAILQTVISKLTADPTLDPTAIILQTVHKAWPSGDVTQRDSRGFTVNDRLYNQYAPEVIVMEMVRNAAGQRDLSTVTPTNMVSILQTLISR